MALGLLPFYSVTHPVLGSGGLNDTAGYWLRRKLAVFDADKPVSESLVELEA